MPVLDLVAGFISLQVRFMNQRFHAPTIAYSSSYTQSNKRSDSYSAVADPLHFLRQIVAEIRGVVPEDFVVGIKLNAADYIHEIPGTDGNDEARVLGHVKEIADWKSVDFIEISGGSYENPGTSVLPLIHKARIIFERHKYRLHVRTQDY